MADYASNNKTVRDQIKENYNGAHDGDSVSFCVGSPRLLTQCFRPNSPKFTYHYLKILLTSTAAWYLLFLYGFTVSDTVPNSVLPFISTVEDCLAGNSKVNGDDASIASTLVVLGVVLGTLTSRATSTIN